MKIKLLSEKWNNLENGLEKEKSERRNLLEDKLRQCDERVTKERTADESKFKVFLLNIPLISTIYFYFFS